MTPYSLEAFHSLLGRGRHARRFLHWDYRLVSTALCHIFTMNDRLGYIATVNYERIRRIIQGQPIIYHIPYDITFDITYSAIRHIKERAAWPDATST